jgi:large subunit ribosomal protein L25
MKEIRLAIEEREAVGGGRPERVRESGYVPAVVYGKGMESKSVKIKTSDLRAFLSGYGKNAIFSAEFADEGDISVLVKDIQYDPVRKDFMHVDFQKISLSEKIHMNVPVRITGRETVERRGGVVAHQIDEITVECLPQDVPKSIAANVSDMHTGQSLTAGQLMLPEGVLLLTEPDSVILTIITGRTEPQTEKRDAGVSPEQWTDNGDGH